MQIKVDTGQLEAVKAATIGIKNGYPRVTANAINRTLTSTKAEAAKQVGKKLNLKQARIKKNFKTRKATWKYLSGEFESTGKPIGYGSFTGTRQTKKGVTVKPYKDQARRLLPHAFMATMKAARKRNVFWRKYEGPRSRFDPKFAYGRLPKRYRLPVVRLTGPRIEDELSKPEVIEAVERHASATLIKRLDHELSRELSKL